MEFINITNINTIILNNSYSVLSDYEIISNYCINHFNNFTNIFIFMAILYLIFELFNYINNKFFKFEINLKENYYHISGFIFLVMSFNSLIHKNIITMDLITNDNFILVFKLLIAVFLLFIYLDIHKKYIRKKKKN